MHWSRPALVLALIGSLQLMAQDTHPTTAWKAGQFVIDTARLVSRSDIVLGQPNAAPAEAMPMGNGRLGIAVWSAEGFTAQLNRVDTLPIAIRRARWLFPASARSRQQRISAAVSISTTEPLSSMEAA